MENININNIEKSKEILCENDKFKSIYFKFDEGKGLPNHVHNGFATIQVVKGTIDISFKDGNKFELIEGDFLPFDATIEHNVIAKETSKVIVTISKSKQLHNIKTLKK